MSQWTSSFSLIGPTGSTGPVGPIQAATDYGSYLYYNSSGWIVGSTSISLGTDAGLTNQGSNSVAIGYKAGETNQPSGSIIINAGGTGLNGADAGLYIKPVREALPNGQAALFYDTVAKEVIHNSIISLSSPNTVVIAGNIVPNSSLAYSLGTSSLRYTDAFFGPGSINIAGPSNASATIGTDSEGIIYTQSGFASPFVNIGPAQLTPQAVGGWKIGPTGTQGTPGFGLVAQELQANGGGPTGPVYSLINAPTGPMGTTGSTGPQGENGVSGGLTFYLDSATTTVTAGNPAIGSLPLTPNLGAQTTISYVATGVNNVLVAKFTTAVGALSSTVVPPGLWDLNIFAATSVLGSAPSFYYSIYQVDADGASNPTLIVSGSNEPVLITNLQSSQTLYDVPLYVPYYTLTDSTKRIQIQLYVNGGGSTRTAYFEFRSGAVSHLHTTLAITPGSTGPAGQTGPTGQTGPNGPAEAPLRSTVVYIGSNAGSTIQNNFAIAVGNSAGRSSQGSNAVAIGYGAGSNSQGQNAIAIGYLAAQSNQNSNSIVLNASGSALNTSQSGLYISPVRYETLSNQQQQGLFFNTATNEVIRNSIITLSSPNTLVVAGHIVPNSNLAYTLGTSSLRFGDAFFGSNSVYIGNARLGADSRGTALIPGGVQTTSMTLGSDSFGYWSIGSTISSLTGPAYSAFKMNRRDIGFATTVAENNPGIASFDVSEDLSAYSTMLGAGSTILFSASFDAAGYSSLGLSSIFYQFRINSIRRITSPFTYWNITNSNVVKSGWVFPYFSSITYGLSSFTEINYKGFQTEWVSSIYHTADDSRVNQFAASSITTNTLAVNGTTTLTATFNPLIFQDSGNTDSNSQYIRFKKSTLNGYLGWGGFNNYGVQSQSTFIIEAFASNAQIALATNSAWRLLVNSNGYVGIGTSVPSYPLQITGSVNTASQTGFLFSKSTIISSIGSSTINASVYANNSVWSGTGFFVTSDERIKTNIEDIQDQVALSTIRAIQPKSYNYIDVVTRGSERVYGFLSQQISSVVQNAVRTGSDVIPNVYSDLNVEMYTDENSTNYIYCSSLSESFVQSLVPYSTTAIFYDANNSKITTTVSSITDSTTATFITAESVAPYVDPSTAISTLFMYGTQVDDLLILNKEYLFTLNLAATQEIDRVQQSALQRISTLEAVVEAQQSTINYLLSRI